MYFDGLKLNTITRENVSSLPKTIYKYRTWTNKKHQTLLTECKIHFSAPNELDNYTENILKKDFSSISKTTILEFCLNTAWEKYVNGEITYTEVAPYTRLIYAKNNLHDSNATSLKEKINRESRNKAISIFCASEVSDNERLWDSFANQKKGYCVGIDFTEFYLNKKLHGTCGHVEYYDEKTQPLIPAISLVNSEGINMILKIIYNLPIKFQQEKEFRFTKMNMKNKTVTLKPHWIKEVILGSDMPDNHIEEIISIVKKKYPNAILKRLFFEPTYKTLSIVDLE